jgi:hypothetical protein
MAEKAFKFLLGMAAFLYLLVLFPFLAPMSCNDVKFNRFRSAVSAIPLPPSSEILFKSEDFGLLWGSSNGCYHRVRMVVATKSDEAAVRSHYAKFTVASPDEQDPEPVRARVIRFPQEPSFEQYPSGTFFPLFAQESYDWYIIEYQGATEPGLDYRCN